MMTRKLIHFILVITMVGNLVAISISQATPVCHVIAPVIDKDPKGLNIRSNPMKDIISKIPYNDYTATTTVHIIDAKQGWLKIDEWSDGLVTATLTGEAWIYGGLVATARTVYDKPVCQNCDNPKKIAQLREDTKVKILNCNEYGWLFAQGTSIDGEKVEGWLPPYNESPNLATTTPPEQPEESMTEGRCYHAKGYITDQDPNGLNVRAEPHVKAEVISKIPYNDYSISSIVDIAAAQNGWLQLRHWTDGAVTTSFDGNAWIYGKLVATLVKVDGDNNIYAAAVHTARKNGQFVPGRAVKVLDCGNEWLFVQGQSIEGKRVKGWLSPYGQSLTPYAE